MTDSVLPYLGMRTHQSWDGGMHYKCRNFIQPVKLHPPVMEGNEFSALIVTG